MRFLAKLNLQTIMAAASVLTIVLALGTVSAVIYYLISQQITQDAIARQNASLRVAAEIVQRDLPGTEVTWGKDGNVERVVMEDIPEEFSSHEMIDTVGRMTSETATVFKWDDKTRDFWRKTTNIVKPDGNRAVGTQLGQNGAVYPVVTKGETFRGEAIILGIPYYTIYEPIYSKGGDIIGILYAGVRKSVINALMNNITSKLMIAFAIILLATGTGMTFLVRGLLRPIPALATVTHRLAENDLDVEVPFADRKNEIGQLANAIATLKTRAEERRELAASQEADEETRHQRQKRIEQMIAGFRSEVQSLTSSVGDTVTGLEDTSRTLTELARESAAKASETATASDEASQNVETVASASEELTASISEISRQIGQTMKVVNQATEGAKSTNEKVASLASAAGKIGEVVTLIQAIAEQTNLLALNATIEAARAGEAGKGFAVVAAEVKELATQTSKATEEISGQISAIQASTREAVTAIGEITETMDEVNGYTSSIASAVEQQGAATNDISQSVLQAARGTSSVTQNMTGLSTTVDQTSAAADEVLRASGDMASKTNALSGEIERFLNEVSAA
ncbi:cache domain-containing protein [Rhizobiales bacterium]|uniref:methyl-accepting chemotaxis protein n=1 Tax=Hongsoonwoonella zoysiae TaxID=2821844 RepID=UPI001560D1A8|nr:methyl-accepting chemotaxis protein [Hongsoonwoonella zoysiae]NRG16176.1 cache domain-containing protein [Hongsoonwoonella zoysiae]